MNQNEGHFESPTPGSPAPPDTQGETSPSSNGGPLLALAPEDYPNVDALVTEDDTPLDSMYTEKQQRLLIEPLYSTWAGPGEARSFVALANVGLFYALRRPPLVLDCLLSLDVDAPDDLRDKNNRSYFAWVFGKMPEVVLEIVSDRRGGEDTTKLRDYARQAILYYAIFDPYNLLGGGVLQVLELRGRRYEPVTDNWLAEVGLGLTLWRGTYEGAEALWLRWSARDGHVIPTGRERIERLEAQLRALGVEPSA
jgi:hypothetical protein